MENRGVRGEEKEEKQKSKVGMSGRRQRRVNGEWEEGGGRKES